MKKGILLLALASLPACVLAQHEFEYWTEVGVEGRIVKKLDWALDLNVRFDDNGLQTFFPQPGISYKLTKWFKPSVEYRFLIEKNNAGNFKSSSRININGLFDKSFDKRLKLTARLRYQFVPQLNVTTNAYDPDFDQAIRLKPKIEYDINDFKLTPELSAEFFYNPTYGPDGRQFSKIRYAGGFSVDTNNPHSITLLYRLDYLIRQHDEDLSHIISLSYSYEF